MLKLLSTLFMALALTVQPVLANPDVAEALKQMAGTWTGSLVYRDYRSDKRVTIPHRKIVHAGPNGAYALHQNEFTDPGFRVFSAELFRLTGDALSIASTTDTGINVESFRVVEANSTASGWQIAAEGQSTDNDKPARVRLLIIVTDQVLEIERQVQADDPSVFQFRNAIRLQRQH